MSYKTILEQHNYKVISTKVVEQIQSLNVNVIFVIQSKKLAEVI